MSYITVDPTVHVAYIWASKKYVKPRKFFTF